METQNTSSSLYETSIIALRMERQHLTRRANEAQYIALYRDCQPGKSVYWDGFGQPPSLSFRADFDDVEFNRARQYDRRLLKGRFAGGNLGWVTAEDFELYACLYAKPMEAMSRMQTVILELIERIGPVTIHQIREETGLPVKKITPVLHRLQQAFVIYEDQYNGEWDRGWYTMAEMFPEFDLQRYTKSKALEIILRRFAYRMAAFTVKEAANFYKLREREIQSSADALAAAGIFAKSGDRYCLASDAAMLSDGAAEVKRSVFALHANDMLVRASAHMLGRFDPAGRDVLRYLLIDGRLRGIVTGKFRYGPNELDDVITDLCDAEASERRDEILAAIADVYGGRTPARYMGREV